MKTKSLTFLLALTFLFFIFILTSCAGPPTRTAFLRDGKEVECHKSNCQLNKDKFYCEVFAETGTPPPRYTSSPSDTSSKVTSHSGTITDQFGGSTYSYRGTSRKQTDFMQKGLQDMSNALGNLARMKQYEERVENRFRKCMVVMMDYNVVQVPICTDKELLDHELLGIGCGQHRYKGNSCTDKELLDQELLGIPCGQR